MTKASPRPVDKPVGSGAFSRVQPRASNGQFAKYEDVDDAQVRPPPEQTVARKRPSTPAQLITRVTRAIERELTQIEQIVGPDGTTARGRAEGEKRARTLASLVRTIAEVTRLRDAENETKADHDDDAVPRDLDEFRDTLERRLAQLVGPSAVASDCGDDAA